MLSVLCLYLKNWFNDGQPKFIGKVAIVDGAISCDGKVIDIPTGQYFRVVGSVFNDGVYKHGAETLKNETFEGAVWLMAVPSDVIALVSDITAWQAKYGGADSQNMSPYNSESFAGYSYSKSGGGTGSSVQTWQSVFADRLSIYRRIRA